MQPARLLYLVTEDWYFVEHRLPMARAARDAGFEVHVAARVDRHAAAIEAEGFHLHPLRWTRGSLDPRDLFRIVRDARALYRTTKPDIAHHVALEPCIIGSLAARGLPMAILNGITGMGFAFTSQTMRARLVRAVVSALIPRLFARRASLVMVENPDDRAAIAALGIAAERIVVIPGSGVDVARFTPLPEPSGPVTAAYVGRLLEDKGLRSLMAAHERLVAQGRSVRLLLAGAADPANPACVPAQVLEDWRKRPGVQFLGHIADIRSVWAQAHIAVLPSRGEGLPLSLVEAAACGRPLVATDVPGCREIAHDGENAILVPVDDAPALADAIAALAADPALRARYGAAGRRLAESEFSSARIGREIIAIYRRLLDQRPDRVATS